LRRTRFGISTQTPSGTATTVQKSDYYKDSFRGRTVVMQRGDSLEIPTVNRPGDSVQRFWQFVAAREGAGLGLPIEILIMQSLQGTMTRAALDMAAGFFRSRAASRVEAFARVREHVIMSTPLLRRGMPPDWRKYTYSTPRAINVDVGRNSQALIAEWQQGFRTMSALCGELGTTPDELFRTRAADWKLARDIEAETGVPPGTCMPLSVAEQPQTEPEPTE